MYIYESNKCIYAQKGTTRTRAVNDRDTATIPPKAKGRVDVNVTDKVGVFLI